jgi:cytochrome c5
MHRILSLGLFMLLSASSYAQLAGNAAPDIGAGKKRAATCFACHNADGISKIPGTPHLAGQERSYLEATLRAYRDGQTRQNATMNAMAKSLSDRDIVNIAAYYSLQTRMSSGQTAAQVMELLERIRPVGNVAIEGSTLPAQSSGFVPVRTVSARAGEEVYKASCMACHATGAAGAPKTGNKAEWTPRLKQGSATLVKNVIQGIKTMPARGGCANCSDAEIKSAVEYLLSNSK